MAGQAMLACLLFLAATVRSQDTDTTTTHCRRICVGITRALIDANAEVLPSNEIIPITDDEDFWPGYCVDLCKDEMEFDDLYETIKYDTQRDVKMCTKCTNLFLEMINASNTLEYPIATWCKSVNWVNDIFKWEHHWLATVVGNLVKEPIPHQTTEPDVVSAVVVKFLAKLLSGINLVTDDVERCSYAILKMHKGLLGTVPGFDALLSMFNTVKATLVNALNRNNVQRSPAGTCHITLTTWAEMLKSTPVQKILTAHTLFMKIYHRQATVQESIHIKRMIPSVKTEADIIEMLLNMDIPVPIMNPTLPPTTPVTVPETKPTTTIDVKTKKETAMNEEKTGPTTPATQPTTKSVVNTKKITTLKNRMETTGPAQTTLKPQTSQRMTEKVSDPTKVPSKTIKTNPNLTRKTSIPINETVQPTEGKTMPSETKVNPTNTKLTRETMLPTKKTVRPRETVQPKETIRPTKKNVMPAETTPIPTQAKVIKRETVPLPTEKAPWKLCRKDCPQCPPPGTFKIKIVSDVCNRLQARQCRGRESYIQVGEEKIKRFVGGKGMKSGHYCHAFDFKTGKSIDDIVLDTFNDFSTSGKILEKFLDDVPSNSIVACLVFGHGTTMRKFMPLMKVGAEFTDIPIHTSWSFVGLKHEMMPHLRMGFVRWIRTVEQKPNRGPAVIEEDIPLDKFMCNPDITECQTAPTAHHTLPNTGEAFPQCYYKVCMAKDKMHCAQCPMGVRKRMTYVPSLMKCIEY